MNSCLVILNKKYFDNGSVFNDWEEAFMSCLATITLPLHPNIVNCRKSSPDQPVKEVKKFWGPVQVLLHCESAKLKMDGASETEFFVGTVPQLEPATLQPFSQCVRMCYLIFTGPVPGDEPWLIFPLPSHLYLLLMPLAVAPQPDIRHKMRYL